ncbi:MAG: hypothetical protein ACREBC_19870 [Pyrinomonadaceae bacterium]
MIYKGVVRGKFVEIEKGVQLPEGTTVEVIVKGQDKESLALSGYPKGSPHAILLPWIPRLIAQKKTWMSSGSSSRKESNQYALKVRSTERQSKP